MAIEGFKISEQPVAQSLALNDVLLGNADGVQGKTAQIPLSLINSVVGISIKASSYFDDGGIANEQTTGRVGDTLYGIIDDYTGEAVTFNKITGLTDDDVDGVIIRKKGTEYFKRSDAIIDIRWFGAIGDGVTSNTAAFQSSISVAESEGGKTIIVPTGVYLTDPITIPTGVKLIGEGTCDLPFFTGGDITEDRKGTILLINGQAGGNCIEIVSGSHNNGIENMSVYNNTTAAIEAVVKIADNTLYTALSNVEIGCTKVTTGTGLLIEGACVYHTYNQVTVNSTGVGQSYEASVGKALWIKSTGAMNRGNAATFIGGDFRGKTLSLHISGGHVVQGIQFLGTTFEGNYNSTMEMEFLADASKINGVKSSVSAYAAKWIKIEDGHAIGFAPGCYFELGGYPETYNDGINGVLPVYPCIELGTNTTKIALDNVVAISKVLDRGISNDTDDSIRLIDNNNVNLIRAIPVLNYSTLQFYPNTANSEGDAVLELHPAKVAIRGNIEVDDMVAGNPKVDPILVYHPDTSLVSKVEYEDIIPTLQEVTDKAGVDNPAVTTKSLTVGGVYVNQGNLQIIKTGGSFIQVSDATNSFKLEAVPVSESTEMRVIVNGALAFKVDASGNITATNNIRVAKIGVGMDAAYQSDLVGISRINGYLLGWDGATTRFKFTNDGGDAFVISRFLVNKDTLDSTGAWLQVNGRISAVDGIAASEVVTKGQLDAKKAAAQADSTATDVAGLIADFNSLLAKMRTAGLLATA